MTTHSKKFLDEHYYWIDRHEKRCFRCHKIKPDDEFTRGQKTTFDKLYSYCKECEKDKHREMYKNNPNQFINYVKKWSDKNPEKAKAHWHIRYAIQSGKIKHPDKCEICGKDSGDIVAHHWHGYDKEHWLDVQWVCRSCHNSLCSH